MNFSNHRKNKVLVNTSIHKQAKLSKKEFLTRIEKFQGLRTRIDHTSLFIREKEDDYVLKDLWAIINEGDFRLRNFPNYVLFVVALENDFYNWFLNSEMELIRKQLCNFISAICLANPDSKEEILNTIYEPYRNEAEYIIKNFYSSNFENKYSFEQFGIDDVQQQRQLILERNSEYKSASLNYLNCPPPKELPNPFEQHISISSFRYLDSAFPKTPVQAAYIRDDDWLAIVERDMKKLKEYYGINAGNSQFSLKDLEGMLKNAETDTMMRAESQKEPLRIWKMKFNDSKNTKNKLFNPIRNNLKGGFVYLFKEKDSNLYKIGYTEEESGVSARLIGIQTGNPRSVIIKGYFPVSSIKTESKLHKYFDSVRKEGEWFKLSVKQAENILDQQWRIDNHIF